MMRTLPPALALVIGLGMASAKADDRPLTDQERTKLTQALQAEGCSAGELEFDDGKFEVDDARCADGKKYDLEYDTAFKLLKKKVED
jgi:hypothetical protein